ncbi:MAG: hypothetical protein M1816_001029 [Peltula sp. TS41687]|nr:MAG: hypothetical protein M1816_001029 [Peltula sp. TS41687]
MAEANLREMSAATQAIHADDHLNATEDVAPPMHVSTTFRYPDEPDQLIPHADNEDIELHAAKHVYSRDTAPNSTRLEAILSTLLKRRAISYSSGLAAYHAALVLVNPKRISIGDAYHGCLGVVSLQQKLTGMKKLALDCAESELQAGDVIHIETPMNLTGEAVSIQEYADKAHRRGAYLLVDATFGPPGLQDPFQLGADLVLHSGTKYLGGHSDMLCGVLAVQRDDWCRRLREERTYLGSMMGSFEGWLGIRSLRTLELRVQRQSRNAESLVQWLQELLRQFRKDRDPSRDAMVVGSVMDRVQHASLQEKDMDWLREQMPNGYGPVFSIWMQEAESARALPSKLRLFNHAASLGGVESLIEWRKMSDPRCDMRLLRISVGVEAWEDLRDDLLQGFAAAQEEMDERFKEKDDSDSERRNRLSAEEFTREKEDRLIRRAMELEGEDGVKPIMIG